MPNRDAKPPLLFVTPASPFAAATGTEQRSRAMLLALAADWSIDVLQLEEGPAKALTLCNPPEPTARRYAQVSAPSHRFPLWRFRPQAALTQCVERAFERPLSAYRLVLGRYLWPVCQLTVPATVPVVADLDDWRFRVDASAPRTLALQSRLIRKAFAHWMARRQLGRMSAVYTVSAADADDVRTLRDTIMLPNVAFHVPAQVAPVPARRQVLFVGSLWYAPNVEAVNWFLASVWPAVRQAFGDAELLLVGSSHPAQRARWAAEPGVKAPGFVDDLARTYADSCAVVVPVLSGGGSNIKVIEALAHARPCIVSGLVHQAFADQFTPGQHYLVAQDAEAFVAHLQTVLRQPQQQQGMAERARSHVMAHCLAPHLGERLRHSLARFNTPQVTAA